MIRQKKLFSNLRKNDESLDKGNNDGEKKEGIFLKYQR